MDIERILQTGETQSVEFKKSLSQTKEGCKTICGMLNAEVDAGMVLFGISPENEVIGIGGNLDSAQRSLVQHIQQKYDPSIKVSIQIEEYEGKKILILSAKRSNDVSYYEYDGRAFIREGSTTRHLSIQEKESLNNSRFDKINILEISEKELEEKLFEIFKQKNSFIEIRFLKNIFAQIFLTLKEERNNFSDKSLLIDNLNKVFIPYLNRIFIIWKISNDYDAFDFAKRMIDSLHKLYVDVFVDLNFDELKGIFDVFWIQSKIIFIVYCMGAYSILQDKSEFTKLLINRSNPFIEDDPRYDFAKTLSWFFYAIVKLNDNRWLIKNSLCHTVLGFLENNNTVLDVFSGIKKLSDKLCQFDYFQCINEIIVKVILGKEKDYGRVCFPSFGGFQMKRTEPFIEEIIKNYDQGKWIPKISKDQLTSAIESLSDYADFSEATFKKKAYFSEATFEESADFNEVIFKGDADFNEVIFKGDADFKVKSFVECVIFEKVRVLPGKKLNLKVENNKVNVYFERAYLEDVYLDISLVTGVLIDFNDALLRNTKIKKDQIKNHILQEKKKEFFEAQQIYLLLKNNFHSIGKYNDESWAFKKEKDMERKSDFHFKTLYKWLWSCFLNAIYGYGEKPERVFLSAILIILFFTCIFMNYGITSPPLDNLPKYNILKELSMGILYGDLLKKFISIPWEQLKNCIYFSTVTFTTLGLGDFTPVESWGRIFVGLEAFIGAFMMALFVYTFARRTGGR